MSLARRRSFMEIIDAKALVVGAKARYMDNDHMEMREALDMAIDALLKQVPQKPYDESKIRMTWYSKCLTCSKELPYVVWHEKLNYCPNCGQRLDWA
jgi:DNA-directed RNA polymerase subunit RPC12/RpoP